MALASLATSTTPAFSSTSTEFVEFAQFLEFVGLVEYLLVARCNSLTFELRKIFTVLMPRFGEAFLLLAGDSLSLLKQALSHEFPHFLLSAISLE